MADNAQVRAVKDYIVKAHKAGACGKDGEHIPREQMGRNGKGVAYIAKMDKDGLRRFRRNFAKIDWSR